MRLKIDTCWLDFGFESARKKSTEYQPMPMLKMCGVIYKVERRRCFFFLSEQMIGNFVDFAWFIADISFFQRKKGRNLAAAAMILISHAMRSTRFIIVVNFKRSHKFIAISSNIDFLCFVFFLSGGWEMTRKSYSDVEFFFFRNWFIFAKHWNQHTHCQKQKRIEIKTNHSFTAFQVYLLWHEKKLPS